ncbi:MULTISPECIES: 50S ribosomal protein L33 [Desulfurella]|uniref:Large ribosomal subunit protein bL33 n=3 Tax=Desulfurella TaxID=33001 RepID=A0A1X4XWX5_9BACT|nr:MULTISPECIES: 50S ribosomal protein L33 [Desulfurella]AHF96673.1 50S ribosomal protein L33 [Desulfurella acetivorans A63]HHS48404.1 50S ribosomal protein L33 [Desulfurella acetivorans]OSS42037.1 LSU ribosomal protein L33p / LSU ribosomal protein L33p, zinc-dependent [Desulfurella amilsii]PMP67898.1 MAG: 50S ribosomal protein L33 [Desulfurella multipotens]PMP87456.1 MAG: 50S ribosomal protein L33 [Desulfurella sp.]
MREIVYLACSQCKNKNYTSTRDKKKSKDKLELRKYCPHCNTHTIHKEVK